MIVCDRVCLCGLVVLPPSPSPTSPYKAPGDREPWPGARAGRRPATVYGADPVHKGGSALTVGDNGEGATDPRARPHDLLTLWLNTTTDRTPHTRNHIKAPCVLFIIENSFCFSMTRPQHVLPQVSKHGHSPLPPCTDTRHSALHSLVELEEKPSGINTKPHPWRRYAQGFGS